MNGRRLDLRGVPIGERPAKVYEVLDALPDGEPLTFVTDLEPRGLMSRIELSRKHEIALDPTRVADREWHVRIRRIATEPDAPSPAGILRRSAAFARLDEPTRSRIAGSASMHTVRRGQAIVTENSEWPFLGIVFEGVCAMSSGVGSARHRIYYEIFPYDVFGETEFFDRGLSVGRVLAISKVMLLRMEQAEGHK